MPLNIVAECLGSLPRADVFFGLPSGDRLRACLGAGRATIGPLRRRVRHDIRGKSRIMAGCSIRPSNAGACMEIKVNFLDNLRLEAKFDDFTVVADQPIRYKGDGSAPGPFDYFLASSALCAAYFVKLYCNTRNIPTDNIRLSQNNIVDPEDRYKQIFKIQVELPADISEKDRLGILRSIERCTVKKVVQTGPDFVIEEVENLDADAQSLLMPV